MTTFVGDDVIDALIHRPTWDERFIRLALEIAGWSKDTSTKVGCVVVGPSREVRSTGYNGMPRGVNDNFAGRHERPAKYFYFEHAERNAVFNAARMGLSLKDCTMYVTSFPSKFGPCADCARAIIQSGITRVVQENLTGNLRWEESAKAGVEMLAEAQVLYEPYVTLEPTLEEKARVDMDRLGQIVQSVPTLMDLYYREYSGMTMASFVAELIKKVAPPVS